MRDKGNHILNSWRPVRSPMQNVAPWPLQTISQSCLCEKIGYYMRCPFSAALWKTRMSILFCNILQRGLTKQEQLQCVKRLRNRQAAGLDKVYNKHFK